MESKLSYCSLVPHLNIFRYCGFYKLSVDSPKIKRAFYSIYMLAVILFSVVFIIQQIMKLFQIKDDTVKVTYVMFLLLTNTAALIKHISFVVKYDEIEELLDIMKGPIFNQGDPEHESLLLQTIRQARVLLKVFNYVALSTCLLWMLYPVTLHIQGTPVEVLVWMPFDVNSSSGFFIASIYVYLKNVSLAMSNTTMDSFISFLFVQGKTQLSILRLNLERLVEKAKIDANITDKTLAETLNRSLRLNLEHYDVIVRFCDQIESIFSAAIFCTFLSSGWIMCTTAFILVNVDPTSMEFVSMSLFMFCALTELILYCYYGNEVNVESENLLDAAYAMDWLQCPVVIRKKLIIFRERIKRPIKPSAGIIIPLSNDTFLSVLKSSYSFFAFLKNSENNNNNV